MLKILAAPLFLIILPQLLFAQKEGQISGTLTGDLDKPLPFATVTVYKAVDTSLVDYVLSEDDGSFQIKKLPLDVPLRVIASFLGYEPIKENFTLSGNPPIREFGVIKMTSTSQTLDEILVQAERPPIMMHNDTLEFNAASFSTRDGATVEDLVKRLPGVVVDNEGNITANGRPVSKVRVDGKDFFGGDPRIAMRNLTSDMISKVQITDDREEDPQRLLADDQVSQVINLKLKKDAKIKAFGKAYAGGGTKDRFEAGGIVNNFQDTFQLSFVGYYNNLTQTNLSMNEMLSLGSFSANRISYYGDGYELNGLRLGATRSGLPLTLFGGANANATFGGTKFNLQYFYANNKVETRSQNFKETTVRPDSVFFYDSDNEGKSTNEGHNVTGGLRWEIDTATQLNLNVGMTYSNGTRPSVNQETSAFNDKDNILQNFITEEDPRSSNVNVNARVYFNKKLNNNGRNLGLNSSFSKDKEDQNLLSNFQREYFLNAVDSIVYFDQLRTEFSDNQRFNINLSYTEPIVKNWFFDLKANYQPNIRINNIETQQHFRQDPDWTTVDDLSNDLKRKENEVKLGTGLRYKKDKIQVNLGLDYSHLNYSNTFNGEISGLEEKYRFLSPNANIILDGWRMSYRYEYRTPDINQLHPIRNNTNPLYIQEGNPDLTPLRQHELWLSKYAYTGKWKYRIYTGGNYRNESIINTSRIDHSGVTYARPINFKGAAYSFYGGTGLNHTFEMENQKLTMDLNLYANLDSGPFFINDQEGVSHNTGIGTGLSFNYNLHDILDFSPRYNIGLVRNTYEKVDYSDVKFFNHSFTGDFTIHLPWNLELQNDLTYRYVPQTTPGYRKSSMMWNAALNKKVLASKKLTIRLMAYDLLDQNIDFYRFVRFNTITDTQRKTLKRYLMLSLIYDFRKTGGQGNERFMRVGY